MRKAARILLILCFGIYKLAVALNITRQNINIETQKKMRRHTCLKVAAVIVILMQRNQTVVIKHPASDKTLSFLTELNSLPPKQGTYQGREVPIYK